MMNITGMDLILIGILLFIVIFLFRVNFVRLKKRYGVILVFIIYISILFCISLFFYLIRAHLLFNFHWYLSSCLIVCMVGGEAVIPFQVPSDPPSSSSWTENSPEPVPAAPVDPDVYQPLLTDEIRKQELGDRLRIHVMGKGYSHELVDSMVETQMSIDKKIEQALLSDGYSRDSLIEKRHEIRGFVLYPDGKAYSKSTYLKYLKYMEHFGTHRSLPYNRIMDGIYNNDLFLSK